MLIHSCPAVYLDLEHCLWSCPLCFVSTLNIIAPFTFICFVVCKWLRVGNNSRFWGRSGIPRCEYICPLEDISKRGRVVTVVLLWCSICMEEEDSMQLTLRRLRYPNLYPKNVGLCLLGKYKFQIGKSIYHCIVGHSLLVTKPSFT